jgi:hypothetical protein
MIIAPGQTGIFSVVAASAHHQGNGAYALSVREFAGPSATDKVSSKSPVPQDDLRGQESRHSRHVPTSPRSEPVKAPCSWPIEIALQRPLRASGGRFGSGRCVAPGAAEPAAAQMPSVNPFLPFGNSATFVEDARLESRAIGLGRRHPSFFRGMIAYFLNCVSGDLNGTSTALAHRTAVEESGSMPVGRVAPLFRMARSSATKELYDVRSARTLRRIDPRTSIVGPHNRSQSDRSGRSRVRMVP